MHVIHLLCAAVLLATIDPAAVEDAGRLSVTPAVISPNGDGVNDEAVVTVLVPDKTTATVEIRDANGRLRATLARGEYVGSQRSMRLRFSGAAPGKTLTDGDYKVVATLKSETQRQMTARLTICSRPRWPPINYKTEPFFPIGVWFEGAPGLAGYPADPAGAKAYYDRSFADLAAHGFNTVAVPNCPEELWEILLASAQEHKIRVILEVQPLASLVAQAEPAGEEAVAAEAKRTVGKLAGYDSLLRYQIRDEPTPEMATNWLVVQRILAALDPKHPAFSCFCQPISLAKAAEATRLSEAVFDIYPFSPRTPPNSLAGFVGSLDAFVTAAGASPKWVVLQAFASGDTWRYPTPQELRATTYLSLAAGARGIFYFIYQIMPDRPDKLLGLVDSRGRPAALCDEAAKLTRELAQLAPLILRLRPTKEEPPSVEGPARAGAFVDGKKTPVLIVASAVAGVSVTAMVSVSGRWKDALTGETLEAQGGVLAVSLAPGAGRVLIGQP